MAGAGSRGRSRGELIRERTRARFVGRQAQVSLFSENLAKDPASSQDPADFLFHVRGVGGVGKSTLLRQWQEAARRAGALTAVVDEGDAHGVPQALVELARQLAEQAGPLKEFDKAAEQYRKDQEAAAAELLLAEGADAVQADASMSSRVAAQAVLGAASFLPGVGAATSMASPDAAAQGLDRLRAGARGRGRRGRGVDASGMNRAFVAELGRLCGRHPWVVLFFDTWEQTGGLLDEWLRDLLEDPSGTLPMNVLVVMAGRGVLAERPWAPLRPHVVDVPLAEFTETETRTLLAARGVTEPCVVDAVLRLSLGLPLLVELLALAEPESAEDVGADADVVDVAVDRFVQWVNDPHDRDAILACALAPRLNEDVFAAAVPQEARGRWGWLCGQPFVSGHGDFKHYHAVVRASMVRQQQAHSPQRWTETHLRLADAHAAWRAAAERDLPRPKLWSDARWLRHRLDETYHRLCAQPTCQLAAALEEAVHAAGQDVAVLRQWVDVLQLAAYDTVDAGLLAWARRLDAAVTGDEPKLAALAALLEHGSLSVEGRGRAHRQRGRCFGSADRHEEALAELNRAVALNPRDATAWGHRGGAHQALGQLDDAIADFTTVIDLRPNDHLARVVRGALRLRGDHHEEAITDLTAALDADPAHAKALMLRGRARVKTERYEDAVKDLTAALELDPHSAFAFVQRGTALRKLGRGEEAIADYTCALRLDARYTFALTQRAVLHREAGRYEAAIADFTTAVEHDPTDTVPRALRGATYFIVGQHDPALEDFAAVLELNPVNTLALLCRSALHQEAGRFDDAVADLTTVVDAEPDDLSVLTRRGNAHRLAGRCEDAIEDLTAVLDAAPDQARPLRLRGVAHRQSRDFPRARADLARAVALQGETVALLFETAMLNTVESGPEAGAEQWSELFTRDLPPSARRHVFRLLQRVVLEPSHDVTEAADDFLSSRPDRKNTTEALLYLSELFPLDGPLAARARRCHRLLAEHGGTG
ncbi:tetratricopeptide repeat protein [Streptomyces spectabilis]|uniref:Tetratricopeptide (TPR) repeat protein n=1 Tax=Streptomyces spectabilis TaxID=68270 RepID=A0A5P2X9P7_STRST|nr:tetratricopeptide repeat protein [Streptomyces spectabilis]MBB5107676.1 tetratricopeptide (TPR) repeat protein [Streptomyces spectabilis]MCI3904658.1 tetratricopeptide repeat protein [Streptomyces spectabilis]QEV61733.1 hypothetical protein CP982_25990 [Streptomyces spectabilis]GGV03390.1 hypothetical protein GCM10010245_08530 [Streptomyces spectabilis]